MYRQGEIDLDIDGLSVADGVEIIKKAFDRVTRDGWINILLELPLHEGYGHPSLLLTGKRPMTDKEKVREKYLKKQAIEKRREQYEELKKEFDGELI